MIRAVYQPLGDQCLLVRLGEQISTETHAAIRRFCLALARSPVHGVTEWVPGYVTVAIYYQPREIGYDALIERLTETLGALPRQRLPQARLVHIPTVYGGEYGPDLEEAAAAHGLSADEVVSLHSRPAYLVHMLGFAPGFPYLGGLPESLAMPRLTSPRLKVPAGSVAIGGAQTGIYPLEMPGGWRLIGRTPLRLFDPDRESPALLRAGDFVRFVPVTIPEYQQIARRFAAEERHP